MGSSSGQHSRFVHYSSESQSRIVGARGGGRESGTCPVSVHFFPFPCSFRHKGVILQERPKNTSVKKLPLLLKKSSCNMFFKFIFYKSGHFLLQKQSYGLFPPTETETDSPTDFCTMQVFPLVWRWRWMPFPMFTCSK